MLRTNNYKEKFVIIDDDAEYPTELIIGQKVSQPKYGEGVIIDVDVDEFDIPTKFTVEFEDGKERKFLYPYAFDTGMKLL